MKKSSYKRSRPYLILIGFCCIAALPIVSARVFNRYPRLYWNKPIDRQLRKYVPVGSSTAEAVRLLQSNGCKCSSDSSEGEPFINCRKSVWGLLGDRFYEISIYGSKAVKKFELYAYHM